MKKNGTVNGDGNIVACPNCGNTLGVISGDFLTVRKRGRVVRITIWEEAFITCEECGTEAQVKRHTANDPPWNGMIDSRNKNAFTAKG